jgi:Flp pilus assembly protein TadD
MMQKTLKWMVVFGVFAVLSATASAQERVSLAGRFREGMVRYDRRDYEGAIRAFEAALKERPDDPRIHYYLGYAYYKNRDFEDARASFEEAYRLRQDFTPLPRTGGGSPPPKTEK